jgi:serine/threonine-protein kinase
MSTGIGVILGTAAYMSPEQAVGRPADKRSDIWAFGCVLYEMLTGKRAFDGEDMTEVLDAVVRLEPHWDALPADVPPPVRTLLQRCLVKDRHTRIADVAAVRFVLEHHTDFALTNWATAAPRPRRLPWVRVAALTAGAVVVAIAAGIAVWITTRPMLPRVQRFAMAPAGTAALRIADTDRAIAMTSDGSRVIYIGNSGTQVFVRSLDHLEPRAVATGSGLRNLFVSPDGAWVGFVEDRGSILTRVAITGGPTVPVTHMDGAPRGATWTGDTIIFATASPATGLQRVRAAGGEPAALTTPDRARGEGDHLWPEFLPGGEAVLFTITPAAGSIENSQIAVLDLRTGSSTVLIRGGSHAHYVPTGHLVYGVTGSVRAVAFDLARLNVVGTPAVVLEGVAMTESGALNLTVAANGSLLYVPGTAAGRGRQTVVSVDRQGHASSLPGLPPDAYRDVRVSPNGLRLALATQDDVWIYDFTRTTRDRLTTDPAQDVSPLWTPDGQRIVFTSRRAGYPELFWQATDGTSREERLLMRTKDLLDLRGNGWSADRKQLLFTEVSVGMAIGQMPIDRPSDVKMLLQSAFRNDFAAVSPDGHWIAYSSNVSGRSEVYVERYPELGNRQLISNDGGRMPLWSHDGRELFFSTPDSQQILAVGMQTGTTLVAGRPRVLFSFPTVAFPGSRPFDLGPDGRFLIVRSGQAEAAGRASNLVLVQHWFEELKRLVPTN